MNNLDKLIYSKDKTFILDKETKDIILYEDIVNSLKHNKSYMLLECLDNSISYMSCEDDIIIDKDGKRYLVLYNNFELYLNAFATSNIII